MKDTIIFFRSIYEAEKLMETADKGKLSMYVQEFLFDGIVPNEDEMSPMVRMAWVCHKPVLQSRVDKEAEKTAKAEKKAEKTAKVEKKQTKKAEKVERKSEPAQAEKSVVETSTNVSQVEDVSPSEDGRKGYSDKVFQVFFNASLPCSNNNPLTFYMTDFKNGLQAIKSNPDVPSNIHSDDVIKACENYVSVLEDSGCYVKMKYSFSSFAKHKNFAMYLPQNFVKSNFEKFSSGKETAKEQEPEKKTPVVLPYERLKGPTKCRKCGEQLFVKDNTSSSCNALCSCGEWVDYDFAAKQWTWESQPDKALA